MRPRTSPIRLLPICAALVLAASCASRATTPPPTPPVADLTPQPKPRLDPAALTSERALAAHDDAVEAWGEAGWATVRRLCVWFRDQGAPGLACGVD